MASPSASTPLEGKPATRIVIPHTSWVANIFWWRVVLFKLILKIKYWGGDKPQPIPLRGPQVWNYPPPLNRIGKCGHRQWIDEESGYAMTVLTPPQSSTKVRPLCDGEIIHTSGTNVKKCFQAQKSSSLLSRIRLPSTNNHIPLELLRPSRRAAGR